MTPEERARAVVVSWYRGPYEVHDWDEEKTSIEIADIAAAIAAALRTERERCARAGICQQCQDGDTPTYNDELRTYYHGPSLCEAREIWALA